MLKKIVIVVVIIFVLLIGALVAVPFIFKDKLLKIAKDEINKQINARVDFSGIGLSVFKDFPHLTFTLKEVSVVGLAPFEGDTLAAIGAFSVNLDVMSVIKGGTIDIRGVNLDEPRLKIIVLEDGQANYDIAKPAEEKEAAPGESETELSIKLRGYYISKGNVIYDDKSAGLFAEINNLNHSGSGDFTLDVFDLKTLTTAETVNVVSGGVKYLNKAELELKIDLGVDLPNNKYSFKENSFRINNLVFGLDGNVILADSTYNLDVTFAAKQTSFKDILSLVPAIYTQDFKDIKTSGEMSFSGFAKGIYQGESYPAFGLKLQVDNAMFQYPSLPTGVNDIFINASIDNSGGDLDNTFIDVSRFDLKLGGEPFSMKLKVKNPVSDPDFDANLVGKIDLGQVTNYYPLRQGEKISGLVDANASAKGRMSAVTEERYNDLAANGRVEVSNLNYVSPDIPEGTSVESLKLIFASQKGTGSGLENLNANATLEVRNLNYRSSDLPNPVRIETAKLALNSKTATLSELKAVVGKSDFAATGNVENLMNYLLNDSTIKGTLNVNSNFVDLNEWMTDGESETASSKSKDTVEVTIAEVPANINFTLTAAIGKVLYDNVELKNVTGNVEVKDQVVKLSFLKANLLDGEAVLNGTYSTKEKGLPKVDFGYDLKNIDIQQAYNTFNTVQKIAPIAKHISGKFNSNLKMTGNLGNDMSLDMNSILANGKVGLFNAKLSDFKVLNILSEKLKMNQFKELSLQDTWTVFEVVDGRVHVEPFDVKAQNINMNVSGSNGLDQSLDYNLLLSVPRNLLGGANDYINDLLNKSPIPGLNASTLPDIVKFNVKVTGTMTDPKVGIGMASKDNQSSLKDKAKEEFDKAKTVVVQRAKEEAEKIMREAEAQAAKIKSEARVLADRTTKEGYAQAQKQVSQVTNPLAKMAAQKAADQLKKETDKKAKQIIDEADKRAQKLVDDARVKAAQVK